MNSNQLYRNQDTFYKSWTSERFTANLNNPQTLSTTNDTVVIFESVGPSLDNISYSAGLFTFHRAGIYTVDVLLSWQSSAVGVRCGHFRINSDTVLRFRDCKNALSSGSSNNNINMTWQFAVGDTLEVMAKTSQQPLDLLSTTTAEINLLQDTS